MMTPRTYRKLVIQLLIMMLLSIGVTMTTHALSPQEQNIMHNAKAKGLIGEQLNGYLGIVTTSPSKEVSALVSKTNAERKKLYNKVATRNKLKLPDVEGLAGKKAINKTKAGQYIQLSNGKWGKK
ncbi:MAG: YdbL family protein [Nitrospirales bacterium]